MISDDTLHACLEDLEARIDEASERSWLQAWRDFWAESNPGGRAFRPPARAAAPPQVCWPEVSVNAALDDLNAMLLQQYRIVSDTLEAGGSTGLNVRSNYGSGIVPTLFGCELFVMEERLNTLPTAIPLGSAEAVRGRIEAGVPEPTAGLGGRVLEAARRFVELGRRYPKIGRWVRHCHPDLQGPIDVAEVVWGSGIFLAFYEDAGLVDALLDLVTETYVRFLRAWREIVPDRGEGLQPHWNCLQRGLAVLRNDSLMNLSPEMYVRHVRERDQRIFDAFGGEGGMHFCGRGDHYIEAMSEMSGLSAVYMSQPEYNDMETIYRCTIDRGIRLALFPAEEALRVEAAGRENLHRIQTYAPAAPL
jgi:hypothetical protein